MYALREIIAFVLLLQQIRSNVISSDSERKVKATSLLEQVSILCSRDLLVYTTLCRILLVKQIWVGGLQYEVLHFCFSTLYM